MTDHKNFTKAVFSLLPEVHIPVERKRYVENFLTPSPTGLRGLRLTVAQASSYRSQNQARHEYLNAFSAGD